MNAVNSTGGRQYLPTSNPFLLEKKLNQYYNINANKYQSPERNQQQHQLSQGNIRYNQDNVMLTIERIQKLKNDFQQQSQQDPNCVYQSTLVVQGQQPPLLPTKNYSSDFRNSSPGLTRPSITQYVGQSQMENMQAKSQSDVKFLQRQVQVQNEKYNIGQSNQQKQQPNQTNNVSTYSTNRMYGQVTGAQPGQPQKINTQQKSSNVSSQSNFAVSRTQRGQSSNNQKNQNQQLVQSVYMNKSTKYISRRVNYSQQPKQEPSSNNDIEDVLKQCYGVVLSSDSDSDKGFKKSPENQSKGRAKRAQSAHPAAAGSKQGLTKDEQKRKEKKEEAYEAYQNQISKVIEKGIHVDIVGKNKASINNKTTLSPKATKKQEKKNAELENIKEDFASTNQKIEFLFDKNLHSKSILVNAANANAKEDVFTTIYKEQFNLQGANMSQQPSVAQNIPNTLGCQYTQDKYIVHNTVKNLWNSYIQERKNEIKDKMESPKKVSAGQQTDVEKAAMAILVPPKVENKKLIRFKQRDNCSAYDPEDEYYIYKDKPRIKGKKYLFFGYNGNYPYLFTNAIRKRGNWKILNYDDQVALITKNLSKRDTQKKVDYVLVDGSLIDKCHFIWRPAAFYDMAQRRIDKRMLRLTHYDENPLVYNHFEYLKGVGTKNGLIRSLKQFYYTKRDAVSAGLSEYDFTPTTFIVTSKYKDQSCEDFMLRFKQIQKGFVPKEKLPLKHCVQNLWLVKPPSSNQGKGIEIFSNLEAILQFVHSRPSGTQCVVQKYIERPLLFKGRKFDIRVWALATTKNEIYFYKEGYLRTSSNKYDLTNPDLVTHLTNQCLQVKHQDTYGVHEDGNTLSYQEFQDYLNSRMFSDQYEGAAPRINIQRDLVPSMRDIVIDVFESVKSEVNPNRRRNNFEFFGFDFMIDEDFRVWLIEVNTNPYLGQPNEWAETFVPNMVDEMLQITIDPLFPPEDEYYKKHRVKKRGYDLIYSEGIISNADYMPDGVTVINRRRSFDYKNFYPIESMAQNNANQRGELRKLRQKYQVSNNQHNPNKFSARGWATSNNIQFLDKINHQEQRKMQQNRNKSSLVRRLNYRPQSAIAVRGSSLDKKILTTSTPKKVQQGSNEKIELESIAESQSKDQNSPKTHEKKQGLAEQEQIVQNEILKSAVVLETSEQKLDNEVKELNKSLTLGLKKANSEDRNPSRKKRRKSKDITKQDGLKDTLESNHLSKTEKKSPKKREMQHIQLTGRRKSMDDQEFQVIEDLLTRNNRAKTSETPKVNQTGIISIKEQEEHQEPWMNPTAFNFQPMTITDRDQDSYEDSLDYQENDEIYNMPEGDRSQLQLQHNLISQETVIRRSQRISQVSDELMEMNDLSQPALQGTTRLFHQLIRKQKYQLIMNKFEEFWQGQPANTKLKQNQLFMEIIQSVTQQYFIEEFANLTDQQQKDILGKRDKEAYYEQDMLMIKFQELLNFSHENNFFDDDLDNDSIRPFSTYAMVLQPKAVNLLIDLLMNQEIFMINKLVLIVVKVLLRISISIPKQLSDKPKVKMVMPQLSDISYTLKEHMLKKAQLKKLVFIHQKLKLLADAAQNDSLYDCEQEMDLVMKLEEVLVNLTCLNETRLHDNALMMNRYLTAHKKKSYEGDQTENLNPVLGVQINPNLVTFQTFTSLLKKSLDIGLIAYLASNQCTRKTNTIILKKALWQCDFETLLEHIEVLSVLKTHHTESQNEKRAHPPSSEYLKIIQDNLDPTNLRHRLRLYYNQRFNNVFTKKTDELKKKQQDDNADKEFDKLVNEFLVTSKKDNDRNMNKKKGKQIFESKVVQKNDVKPNDKNSSANQHKRRVSAKSIVSPTNKNDKPQEKEKNPAQSYSNTTTTSPSKKGRKLRPISAVPTQTTQQSMLFQQYGLQKPQQQAQKKVMKQPSRNQTNLLSKMKSQGEPQEPPSSTTANLTSVSGNDQTQPYLPEIKNISIADFGSNSAEIGGRVIDLLSLNGSKQILNESIQTPKSPKSSGSRGSRTKQLKWDKNSLHLLENPIEQFEEKDSNPYSMDTLLVVTPGTELSKNLQQLGEVKQKLIQKVQQNLELNKNILNISTLQSLSHRDQNTTQLSPKTSSIHYGANNTLQNSNSKYQPVKGGITKTNDYSSVQKKNLEQAYDHNIQQIKQIQKRKQKLQGIDVLLQQTVKTPQRPKSSSKVPKQQQQIQSNYRSPAQYTKKLKGIEKIEHNIKSKR